MNDLTALATHSRQKCNVCNLTFNGATILAHAENDEKRKIFEFVEIMKHDNTIDYQTNASISIFLIRYPHQEQMIHWLVFSCLRVLR